MLSTCLRLSFLVRELYKEELAEEEEVKIQPNIFYLEDYNFLGIERVGGLFHYLKTKYKQSLNLKLPSHLNYQSDEHTDGTSCKSIRIKRGKN